MSESLPISERSPILRFLRGRSPRRFPRATQLIASSAAPAEIRDLVRRIVRRVGGTRAERIDVARELLAHFDDALARGASPIDAIVSFGDERRAAKLLRRAVRRKRGLIWKSWWWSSRAVAALFALAIVVYAIQAARFFLVRPTISTDSIARLRALVPCGPASEQAWPIIREALKPIRDIERGMWGQGDRWQDGVLPMQSRLPGSDAWNAASEELAAHRDSLEALRRAARLPALGTEYGKFSPEDKEFFWQGRDEGTIAKDDNAWSGALFALVLPHLAPVRGAARWLELDAVHAAAERDGARCAEDIEAILGIARQQRGAFLVDQLVAFAIYSMACEITIQVTANLPDAMNSAQLAQLEGVFDRLRTNDFTVNFEGERIGFDDTLQRLYSDDGSGDGHLVSSAFGPHGLYEYFQVQEPKMYTLLRAAAPAMSLMSPSRREAKKHFEHRVCEVERLARRPIWEWTGADWDRANTTTLDLVDPLRMLGLQAMFGNNDGFAHVVMAPFVLRQRVDVARLALALRGYEREHGAWPGSLEALDADLVASTRDMYDGKPLRYALHDGAPAVWSIGPDRIDDHMSTATPIGFGGDHRWVPPGATVEPGSQPWPRGDAQLWPPLREDPPTGQPVLISR